MLHMCDVLSPFGCPLTEELPSDRLISKDSFPEGYTGGPAGGTSVRVLYARQALYHRAVSKTFSGSFPFHFRDVWAGLELGVFLPQFPQTLGW